MDAHWRWWRVVELALHVPPLGDILLANVATQVLNIRHSIGRKADRGRAFLHGAAPRAVVHATTHVSNANVAHAL